MILLALTTLGLALGHIEITRQQRVIAEAQQLQQADIAAIADWVSVERDGGSAAYYSFHLTWECRADEAGATGLCVRADLAGAAARHRAVP
jgi:ABC-2 type transport system permease protein